MLLMMLLLHHVLLMLLRIVHSLGSVGNDSGGATRKYLHLGVIAWSGSHLGVETAAGAASALWLHAVGGVARVGSRRDSTVAGLLHVLLLLLLLLLGSGGGIDSQRMPQVTS